MKQTRRQTRAKEKRSATAISKNNEVPVEWRERVNASWPWRRFSDFDGSHPLSSFPSTRFAPRCTELTANVSDDIDEREIVSRSNFYVQSVLCPFYIPVGQIARVSNLKHSNKIDAALQQRNAIRVTR